MAVISRRTECRLCNSRNLELVFQLARSPIGDAYIPKEQLNIKQDTYPIDLFMCRECGLFQLLDIIDPAILYSNYIYLTGSSPGLREHFKKYADDTIKTIAPAKESLIVDIGSNDGILLSHFKKFGHKVLGVDPAPHIARLATLSGVKTLPAFFTPDLATRIVEEYGQASVITANNVYANIDDLATFTEGIRYLMTPDGVFIFESFYIADLVQHMVFDFIYHEHLSAFSVKPLQFFFNRIGMELIAVMRVPTKGGSLRYFVQRKNGPRKPDPSVASLIDYEESYHLYDAETFKTFSGKVSTLKKQTTDLLQDLKAQGARFCGYGASITVTTLIYHFGIGEFLDYLVDDNPDKQNRLSPGLHLPVYSPEMLYENRPPYTIILAWRFAGQIIDKHRQYVDQTGHFIIPVPAVRMI